MNAPSFESMARALNVTPEQIRAYMVNNVAVLRQMHRDAVTGRARRVNGTTVEKLAERIDAAEARIAAYDAAQRRLL